MRYVKKLALVLETWQLLKDNELTKDACFYWKNGDVWYCFDCNTEQIKRNSPPTFYYANENTISMSFEGSLYDVINGYTPSSVPRKLYDLFAKYGYYSVLGDAWNFTLYEN